MQAIGKLAQTLAGEYVQHQSLGNLAQAQERTALNLADQIAAQGDPNNPFVAALRNPATRAVAMQVGPEILHRRRRPTEDGGRVDHQFGQPS